MNIISFYLTPAVAEAKIKDLSEQQRWAEIMLYVADLEDQNHNPALIAVLNNQSRIIQTAEINYTKNEV
jgi:hypothetical protein|tara:strand:+ start:166 stop:372 length:207 start_codon:yes stop_codon:yes gene_type:complete